MSATTTGVPKCKLTILRHKVGVYKYINCVRSSSNENLDARMQSHSIANTLIVLEKHKLQFRLKVHNNATLQKQG